MLISFSQILVVVIVAVVFFVVYTHHGYDVVYIYSKISKNVTFWVNYSVEFSF